MRTRTWLTIIVFLGVIIFVLAWLLFTTPTHVPITPATQEAATTTPSTPAASTSSSQTGPLDAQVTVTAPRSGATVSHTFSIAGKAPSQWYFEAVFPIQVRDSNDDLIGASQGRAQTDWMQPGLIEFKSQMTVDASYSGPATLILLKDNPSGNPETSDEVTVPITIQ